jgi:hypothetical protein
MQQIVQVRNNTLLLSCINGQIGSGSKHIWLAKKCTNSSPNGGGLDFLVDLVLVSYNVENLLRLRK